AREIVLPSSLLSGERGFTYTHPQCPASRESGASTRQREGGNCSRVKISQLMNPAHMDLLLAPPGPGDVVRGLHPHECVHLHSESLLNAQRHVPGKVGLAVEQARQRRPGYPKRGGGSRHRQTGGLDNLRPDEISRG